MVEFLTTGHWWGWLYGALAFATALYARRCRRVVVAWVAIVLVMDWAATAIAYEMASDTISVRSQLMAAIDFAAMFVVLLWATDDKQHKDLNLIAGLYGLSLLTHATWAFLWPVYAVVYNVLFAAQLGVVCYVTRKDNVHDGDYENPWWWSHG